MGWLRKLKNWYMERIPEIERPACGVCKRTMYWNRDREDWACQACDDYDSGWEDFQEDYWDDDDDYD